MTNTTCTQADCERRQPATPGSRARAWELLRTRKARRLTLLAAGAAVGALCPYLPAALLPLCEASADVARALSALLTGGF